MLLATISSRDFSPPSPPIASVAAMIAIWSAARFRKLASCSASTCSSLSSEIMSAASVASMSLPPIALPRCQRFSPKSSGLKRLVRWPGWCRSGRRSEGGNGMKFKLFVCLLAVSLAAAAARAEDRPPPKLVVAISVDQFSADLFAQYRQHFTGGLRRLSEGVVFPSGYQSHNLTETCPGHSTILTGSRPARTGIISNDWYDQSIARPDKKV